MPVYPNDSTLYDGSTESFYGPDSPVWLPASHMIAGQSGWPKGSIELTTSWRTLSDRGNDLSPNRNAGRSRPSRIARHKLWAFFRDEQAALRAQHGRSARGRFLMPLLGDMATINPSVIAGATAIPCDAADRRFFDGGRVLIIEPVPFAGPHSAWEIADIAAVAGNSLTLTAGLANAYPTGSRVLPLIECDPQQSSGIDLESDHTSLVSIEGVEAAGRSAAPAWIDAGLAPVGAQLFTGAGITAPIFDCPLDWPAVTSTLDAEHDSATSGLSTLTRVIGDRALATVEAGFKSMSRTEAVRLLRWFDGRRGRLHPLWLPIPASEIGRITAVGTSSVTTSSVGLNAHLFPLGHIRHLVFSLRDGSIFAASIEGLSANTGPTTLSLSANPTFGVDDVLGVSALVMATFDSDELTESWETPEAMTARIRFREVCDELSSAYSGPPRPEPPDYPPPGNPPGGPPGEPPGEDPCHPLDDCNGNPTGLGIPADGFGGSPRIYNPNDGGGYAPGIGTVPCKDVTIVTGYQPGDGTEPWWPVCPPPPVPCDTDCSSCGSSLSATLTYEEYDGVSWVSKTRVVAMTGANCSWLDDATQTDVISRAGCPTQGYWSAAIHDEGIVDQFSFTGSTGACPGGFSYVPGSHQGDGMNGNPEPAVVRNPTLSV